MCFCALAGAPPVVAQTTVDISTVHVGPDSFRLGEYSGLQRSGNYFRGNFTTGKSSAWNDTTGKYWQARGLDLGLDTLGLRFDAGARGRYDFSLPGSIKINSADLVSQGQAEVKEVEEEIKGQSNSSFFFMVKK